nr:hypothetical protein [Prauserella endophytica]
MPERLGPEGAHVGGGLEQPLPSLGQLVLGERLGPGLVLGLLLGGQRALELVVGGGHRAVFDLPAVEQLGLLQQLLEHGPGRVLGEHQRGRVEQPAHVGAAQVGVHGMLDGADLHPVGAFDAREAAQPRVQQRDDTDLLERVQVRGACRRGELGRELVLHVRSLARRARRQLVRPSLASSTREATPSFGYAL